MQRGAAAWVLSPLQPGSIHSATAPICERGIGRGSKRVNIVRGQKAIAPQPAVAAAAGVRRDVRRRRVISRSVTMQCCRFTQHLAHLLKVTHEPVQNHAQQPMLLPSPSSQCAGERLVAGQENKQRQAELSKAEEMEPSAVLAGSCQASRKWCVCGGTRAL